MGDLRDNAIVRGGFTLPREATVLGVDWSGAFDAGRKIWAAQLGFSADTVELARLERPFAHAPGRDGLAARFGGWLAAQEVSAAGLDFCFSLPHDQLARLGSTAEAAHSPQRLGVAIAQRYADADAFRAAAGPEARRATDRESRSPFAPTNLRMYRQTYLGLSALGHVPGAAFPPWSASGPRQLALVEVLPAQVARALGVRSYKGADRASERRELLERARAQLGLSFTPADGVQIVDDREGDALDAVLAAFAAASALARGFPGARDPEGLIYELE